jgi:hypothetical protein
MITVEDLIAHLQTLPKDLPLVRSCGGDCPGYTAVDLPYNRILYPEPKPSSYGGEFLDEREYESAIRVGDERDVPQDYRQLGREFIVF